MKHRASLKASPTPSSSRTRLSKQDTFLLAISGFSMERPPDHDAAENTRRERLAVCVQSRHRTTQVVPPPPPPPLCGPPPKR